MAWKCSLDDRDEAVAWLALWGPTTLREAMKAGQKPSFEAFKERVKADFGELAAEALARPAYDESLRQMAAMVRLIPALEVMKEGGKAAGGPDMVPAGEVAPIYQPGYAPGGRDPTPTRETISGQPRVIARERMVEIADEVGRRGTIDLWLHANNAREAKVLMKKGGFTWSPALGGNVVEFAQNLPSAYAVSIPGTGVKLEGKTADKVTVADIRKVIADNVESGLFRDPRIALGGWYSEKDNATWIEASVLVHDKATAVKLGKEWNQQAVTDLKSLKTDNPIFVPTGGTGETPAGFKFDPAMLDQHGIGIKGLVPAKSMLGTTGANKLDVSNTLRARADSEGTPLAHVLIKEAERIEAGVASGKDGMRREDALGALRSARAIREKAAILMSGEPDAAKPRHSWSGLGSGRSIPNDPQGELVRVNTAMGKDATDGRSPEPHEVSMMIDRVFKNPRLVAEVLADGIMQSLKRHGGFGLSAADLSVGPQTVKALQKYLGDMIDFVANGAEGEAPALPSGLGKMATFLIDPVKLVGDLRSAMRDNEAAIEDSVAGTLPAFSTGYKLLKSGLPNLIREVVAILSEKGIRIPPDLRINLRLNVPGYEKALEQQRRDKAREEHPTDAPLHVLAEPKPIEEPKAEPPKPGQSALDRFVEDLTVKLPSSAEALLAGEAAAADWISHHAAGGNDAADAINSAKGGWEWGTPNPWDIMRPSSAFTLRKLMPQPWAEAVISLIRSQGSEAAARRHTINSWMRQEFHGLWSMMRRLTPEAKVKLQKELIGIAEGEIQMPINAAPEVVRAVSAMQRLFKDYSGALKLLGVKVRKHYFPHVFEYLAKDYEKDPVVVAQIKQLRSRFFNARKTEDPHFLVDMERVLDMYVNSVERVITWQPVRNAFQAITEAAAKKGSPIPVRTQEWFGDYFSVLEGRPGSLDRFIRRVSGYVGRSTVDAINAVGQTIAPRWKGIAAPGPQAGLGWIRGLMSANYVGALGANIISPIKNLSANIQSIANVGLGNWTWGLYNIFQKNDAGQTVLHPLVRQMALWDMALTRDTLGTNQKIKDHFMQMGRDVADTSLALFDASEFQLRATVALAAVRKFFKSKDLGTLGEAEIRQAIAIGRDAAARTQAEYNKYMGGLMLSSDTAKVFLQFGRYGMHYLDLLQLTVRAAIPGKLGEGARRMMPLYAHKDSNLHRLSQVFIIMGGLLGASAMLNGLGIRLGGDTAGPGGAFPQLGKAIVNSAVRTATSVTEDDELAASRKARDISRTLGTDIPTMGMWESFVASFGPVPDQLYTAVDFAFASPDEAKRALGGLERSLTTAVPFGIQANRMLRAIREDRERVIRSSVADDKIFPAVDQRYDEATVLARFAGFQPEALAHEYEIINDQARDRKLYHTLNGENKDEFFKDLREGADRSSASFRWMSRWYAIQHSYGRIPQPDDANKELARVLKEYELERKFTRAERVGAEAPFTGEVTDRSESRFKEKK